ncbi:hypothetical protein O7599_29485 [Streptomyces sp. WMMC500]|uniref:hypothetical protein n=1 Tax=Streptomyces sp. WMMC500 TaxID=3015154 RepID=UPI00248B07AE|nr:hypothetical protein [Streptomyces sp. WMMC500]WBB59654.1 hypothetical protein O7599_29485 [Streptomyces sp. WMMC500]
MKGARERDGALDRQPGVAGRLQPETEAPGAPAPDGTEPREPSKGEPSKVGPAKADPAHGGPATTDEAAAAETVAADPVAVADPVAPAPRTPASASTPASPWAPASADPGRDGGRQLLDASERDELGDRLQRATGRFVDNPPAALDDAGVVLDEVGRRIAALLAERRDACRDLTRAARRGGGTDGTADAETERLRLALRDCRDLAERLLAL